GGEAAVQLRRERRSPVLAVWVVQAVVEVTGRGLLVGIRPTFNANALFSPRYPVIVCFDVVGVALLNGREVQERLLLGHAGAALVPQVNGAVDVDDDVLAHVDRVVGRLSAGDEDFLDGLGRVNRRLAAAPGVDVG